MVSLNVVLCSLVLSVVQVFSSVFLPIFGKIMGCVGQKFARAAKKAAHQKEMLAPFS